MKKKKIYVAMSGGVDSSVTATILKKDGYNITGVYFKTYQPDGNTQYCKQQMLDAQKVCEQLQIPFKVFDLENEYKQKVFDYMIAEYKAGHTPNPDIICNKYIKFGVFLKRAIADGAELIATGHYARLKKQFKISYFKFKTKLLQAIDTNKDQSYFLSQLNQKQLSHCLFPLGNLHKKEVRKLAKEFNLHTADKPDSQGICFIGHELHVKDFLKKYIPEKKGNVLDIKGNIIGSHFGTAFYTIGERHNLSINPQYQTPNMPRLFIIEKDIKSNTLTIGTKQDLQNAQNKKMHLKITNTNWISQKPRKNKIYTCRIRHRGEFYKCILRDINNKSSTCNIKFKEIPYAPAPGQFLAIYNGKECIGGGVIH